MAYSLKRGLVLAQLLFLSVFVFSGNNELQNNPKVVKKKSFRYGEELVYSLNYGPIHGGSGSIILTDSVYKNKKVYHASVIAKSAGITDLIYKIQDIYESFFDTVTCLPYKSIRNISEGGYKDYDEVYFAHNDSSVYSKKNGTIKVPPDILDIVSSLFYLRSLNLDTLKNGEVLKIITFFGDEIFPFPIRYRGKEVIKTKFGKFECYKFDPVVEVGRMFSSEDDMTFWITADPNLIPLRVRLKLIVGSVYCDLVSFKNLSTELQPIK
jgi:hypothetical protein